MTNIPRASALYPSPSQAALQFQYIGKTLNELPAPSAILDAASVRRNCRLMLEAVQKLGVGFRAHVKTHKTLEVTKLSVGEAPLPVKLVASTVAEIEGMLPWLRQCRDEGRKIHVFYGFPITPSAYVRLAAIARQLGPGTIGLFVDHPNHIDMIERLTGHVGWPGPVSIFVNIDIGDHREGVPATSRQLVDIATKLGSAKQTQLDGLYTYLNRSYQGNTPGEALAGLAGELEGLGEGTRELLAKLPSHVYEGRRLTLSVGTTPTATATQNLLEPSTPGEERYHAAMNALRKSFDVEIHAGVYTLLDLQQLATRARPLHSAADPSNSLLSHQDLAFRILAEVASVYSDRCDKPEALMAAGSIALGREPCKSYQGWGVVTPWPEPLNASSKFYDPEGSSTGWKVGKVSQEHGSLVWEGSQEDGFREIAPGDKVMIWPNHACIAGIGFGWYFVIDSEVDGGEKVQDVWLRWRGW